MWEYTDYVWPFVISVLVSIALLLYAWPRRDVRACLPFIILIAMAGYWSLASGLHALAVGLGPKVLLSDLHYPVIVMLPVAWFAFALSYSGRRNTLTPGQIAGLLVVPALTLVLIVTNASHGLMFKEATLDTSGPIASASRTYGVWFWAHTAYSYGLIVVGVALILLQRIHAARLYRRQSTLMLTGALTPFFFNIIFLSAPGWFANIDMTPIAFTVSCVFFGVGLFWFRLLDLMPVAHAVIFESIPEAIVVLDTQYRVVNLNPVARRLFGEGAPANAIGMPITDLVGDLDFIPEETVAAAIAGEILLMIDGEKQFFEWQMSPFQDCHDRMTKCLVVLVLRDITEQKQTVQALQESKERYRTLIEHAPDAIVVMNMENGHFVDCNREAELLFGLSHKELLLTDPITMSPPTQPDGRPSPAAALEELQRAIEGDVCFFEWTHRNAAGEDIPCEIRLIRLPSTDQVLIRGSITNIAERKRAEVAFREHYRMQRLDSLGALAGGVAHDMNNILGSVLMSLEWFGMTTKDENTRKLLTTVETSVHRGADLVRQLLTFARGVEGELTTLSLKLPILELEEILHQTLPPSIVFVSDIDEDLWAILGDATQLHQVLMNLCVNARDAMPSGGILSLAAGNRVVEQPQAGHQREIPAGRHVVLSVSDTGIGMPPEVQDKVFDPFYTTKETGTGLGLSTSLGIITSHGGFIDLRSDVGNGTRFDIYLPAAEDTQAQAAHDPEAAWEVKRGRGELVLLVEDSLVHQAVGKDLLEAYGYRVVAADDGAEALALFEQQSEEIEVVVTDIMMPVMDGYSLISALREQKADLNVVAMSGLKRAEDVAAVTGAPVQGFLSKPFKVEAMLAVLDEVLTA